MFVSKVKARNRSVSKLAVYHNALKMNSDIVEWLSRDFGSKETSFQVKVNNGVIERLPRSIVSGIETVLRFDPRINPQSLNVSPAKRGYRIEFDVSEECGEEITRIGISRKFLPEYIRFRQTVIMRLLARLLTLIARANCIYPSKIEDVKMPLDYVIRIHSLELAERRRLQDKALGCCEALITELEICVNTIPIKPSQVERFIEMTDYEIRLLKGWRKSTNAMAKKIKKADEELAARIDKDKKKV
ncbi:MAG: hypothetical protein LBG27_14525 [Spirochaetaceae bacterium]|jgi:hypothetical protein|nr:hypothetical protein [Spirochaetaceae bacterium]